MIQFDEFVLENGLRVILQEDESTSFATVNLLYNVGSKHEHSQKTGFAHLFEHFMFEGSKHIPHFDKELQRAGGENNAFTTSDYTNYYSIVPVQNIETALWLESDRMCELAFSNESFATQQSVVCEEFKENYINQPYGDVWHHLLSLSYAQHPYKWPTIGKHLTHIKERTLQEAKDFFYTFYRPNNCILTISGGIQTEPVKQLVEKWFAHIPRSQSIPVALPNEPEPSSPKTKIVEADVPTTIIYKTYLMPERTHPDYTAFDLLSDVLGSGFSSRLYISLVKEQSLFTHISSYITGAIDKGLFVIQGKVAHGINEQQANEAIDALLKQCIDHPISDGELNKAKNKFLTSLALDIESHTSKAFELAYGSLIGNTNWINEESASCEKVSSQQVNRIMTQYIAPHRCNTLIYKSQSAA